jgi:hypothetical protein
MAYTGFRQQHPLRDRILAFYRHYCPEKPASHVDFLLDKYTGHEEEVLQVLREKYGPEPADAQPRSDRDRIAAVLGSTEASDILLEQFRGQSAVLRSSLMDRYDADGTTPRDNYSHRGPASLGAQWPSLSRSHGHEGSSGGPFDDTSTRLEQALAERKERFDRDMELARQQDEQRKALEVMQAVTEVRLELQRQDVELQQLRLALATAKAQNVADQAAHDEAIRALAQQLTRAKLRLLTLQSDTDPTRAAATRLDAAVAETAQVEDRLQQSVQYCRCLAEAARRHLRTYPLSPMHATLRNMDPAMCARLEQ